MSHSSGKYLGCLKQPSKTTKYGKCRGCNKSYRAELPEGVSWRWFGTNIQAQLSELTTRYKLSRRDAVSVVDMLYGFKLCLGSVSNYEELTSQAAKGSYEEIKTGLKKSGCINVDETGYSQKGIRRYAWIVTTIKFAMFACNRGRGKKVAKELIGKNYKGFVITDRYPGYEWLDPEIRQLCWAHLIRDFVKISLRGGDSEIIANQLLEYCKKMFVLWREFLSSSAKDARELLKTQLKPIREAMISLMEKGTIVAHLKSKRTFEKILKLKISLWTFVDYDGVEPTNNLAERGLRPLVIHRKKSFGTQSDRGSRFIERLFSLIFTANLLGISVSEFLKDAINAFKAKKPCPNLVKA